MTPEFARALSVALVILLLPGAVAAALLGFRRFTVLAVAAPLSLAGIALFSLIDVVLPFGWNPLTWAASAALVVAVAIAVRTIVRRSATWAEATSHARMRDVAPWLAVLLAAAIIAVRLLDMFGDPANISQTFDNVYHLNAVRYVVDTGRIAPTAQMIPGFYPSLWHALTAAVMMMSGAGLPVAVNAVSVVMAAVVWPASVILFTRRIIGDDPVASLSAGVLSAALAGFPYLMLDHGVLYPNVLSIAVLPAVLAMLLQVAGVGEGARPPALVRWLLLMCGLAVLGLAHPSTLMAFFAIGVWPALAGGLRWLRTTRGASHRRVSVPVVLGAWAIGVVAVAILLIVARPTREQAFWPPSQTLPVALTQVLANSVAWKPMSIAVTVVMLLGIILIVWTQRRLWWLIAGWMTIASIYVVCAAAPDGLLRYGLTGTWYSDLFRIAALLPVLVVPLGAVGIALTATALSRVRGVPEALAGAFGIAAALGVLVVTQTGANLEAEMVTAREAYALTSTSPLLSEDEEKLLQRLPEHVSEDETVAGSPWTGTALSYAIAERLALIPHIYQEPDADIALLSQRLVDAATDSSVCAAIERTDTRWVLDFGLQEVHGGAHSYPGFIGLDTAEGFELVDSEGAARLFLVTACE